MRALFRPKAILFDWDGTLVDSYDLLRDAHNHARQALGFETLGLNGFRPYFGKPREAIYLALYGDKGPEAKMLFEAFVKQHHRALIKPIHEAGRMLALVHDLKIPMAIVSNKRRDFITQEVEALGWDQYFKVVLGAGDAGRDKPFPDPALKALEMLGFSTQDAQDLWYVGDTDMDMACAKGAGVPCIFISSYTLNDRDKEAYKPLAAYENYEVLVDFLLQCSKN